MLENSEPKPTKSSQTVGEQPAKRLATPWLVLMMPLVVVCIILCFSPNYRLSESVRATPLGGDFLQEWVGGWIVSRGEQARLYDLEYVQTVQHDPAIVGFQWPEKDYFPMVYPPYYYLLISPLSFLGYPVAMKLWAVLSGLALTLSGYLIHRFYPPCRRLFGPCFVGAMLFVPLLVCLNMGQKSTFLVLILTCSFLLLYHRRPFAAGLVFGLIAFKPHLGLVIGLTMLMKRQWRFAGGALSVVALLVGGSFAVNPELWGDYLDVVSGMGEYVQTGGYQLSDAHSLWGGIQLLLPGVSSSMIKWLAITAALGVVGLLWSVMRGPIQVDSPIFARQFSAMIFATVVLSPHFYAYDLAILLVPMILIVTSYPLGGWRQRAVDRNLGCVLLGMFGLAGLFSKIAGVTRIQPSIILIVAAIVLIGMTVNSPGNPKLANRSSAG